MECVVRGILFVLSQGCEWRAIDQPGARWNSVYQYYLRWSKSGFWEELWKSLARKLKRGCRFLDSTHVKAHRCAANPRGGQSAQCLGRTKGGLNTKIHATVDSNRTPEKLYLSPGNDADVMHAETVLEGCSGSRVVADKGYDSDALREDLYEKGIEPCIPARSNRLDPLPYSKAAYRKRHKVENYFERIKTFRRVATRYDKLAATFLGFVYLATIVVGHK